MKLYTVTDNNIVIEFLSIQLTDKLEEKAEIIAAKGWKFFFKEQDSLTVVASMKDGVEIGDKYLGSTRIVKKDGNVRKEIILLVNETFHAVENSED